MKMLTALALCSLFACKPSADNNNAQHSAPNLEPNPISEPISEVGIESKKDDPVLVEKLPDPDLQLKGCSNSSTADSDHILNLEIKQGGSFYTIDFKDAADRSLNVISLYVTAANDEVPTFKNGFKFSGTAYWMVAVDDPFDVKFSLPTRYGELPKTAVDVSESYGGLAGGGRLAELKALTCLKVTVVTFEPEAELAFKTSTFLLVHKP